MPGVTFRQVLVAYGKSNQPWRTIFIWHSLLTLSQSNIRHQRKENGDVGEAGAGPPMLMYLESQVSVLIVLVRCCEFAHSPRQLEALLWLLLSKSFQIHVSSFLIPQLYPCGYSTDQRVSSGLKQALLCSRSQTAFPGNNDD